MWHKPCRTFHPWCLCIKTRCLCPIYRAPGLKHLKKTQGDIRIGIFCQKNQGHWWRWCRDSIHDSEEIWPMAPTKNKTWVLQNNVLSQQKFSGPHGNSENNMNQLDKTNTKDISCSYVKITFQLITNEIFVVQNLHLCHFVPLETVIVARWYCRKLFGEYFQGICSCVE